MLDRRVSGSHRDIKAAIMVRIPSITRGKVTDTPGNWAYKPTKTQSNELRCQRRLETIKKLEYSWLSLICNFECYDNTRKQTLCWESYHEAQISGKLKRKLSASNLQRKPAEYDRLFFTYLTPRNGTMYNLKITVTISKERLTRLKSEFPLGLLKISSHQRIQFIKCLVCAAKCDWQYAMYGLERPNSSHEKTMNISWGKIYSAMFLLFPMVQLTSAMMKGTTMPPIREKVEQVPRAIFLQKNINYLDATVSETFWRKTKGFLALQRKMRDITTCFFKAEGLNCFRERQKRFGYHRKFSSSWRLSFVIMVQITWWSWGTIHCCTSIRSRTRLIQRIVQSAPMPLLNLSDLFGQRAPCQLLSFISVFLNYNLSFKLSVITRVCFDLVAFGELDREKKSCYLPGAMGSCV